jgi:predicted phosphodiesterase
MSYSRQRRKNSKKHRQDIILNGMRLAIFSDIHSNLEALTTADRLLTSLNIDEIVCLGDIVGYGADPNPCIEYVRANCKIIVRGNHDYAMVDTSVIASFTHRAAEAARWTIGQLTPENSAYLASLPLVETAYECTFVHSSPFQPDEWEYIIHPVHTNRIFPFFSTPLCFFGHTHIPVIFREGSIVTSIERKNKFLVNPGSIGQPRDGDPRLCFGVLDTEEWTFDFIRSAYDVDTTAIKIVRAGLPPSLGERLYLGT